MTVNSDCYCDVLRRLRENVRRKRMELWRNHNWLLHHNNRPSHTSLKTTEFLTNNNMVIIPHPPYSLDLAPWFCFVSQIENETEGTFWNSVWYLKGIAGGTQQHSGQWLPQCFWSVEKTMGSLYMFPRRLFWRRWHPKFSKLSQHFFSDQSRNFPIAPCNGTLQGELTTGLDQYRRQCWLSTSLRAHHAFSRQHYWSKALYVQWDFWYGNLVLIACSNHNLVTF
jgi:hypothetical protein